MTPPNILFVVLDTARAQTVLPGLENGVMPATGRIAEEGTTFSNASTVAPWTLPSHASLFTGQHTSDHGTHRGDARFDPSATPLAVRLRERGYTTAAISGNVWVSPEFGFDAGFDQFSMKWDLFWDGADLSAISAAESPGDQLRELRKALSLSNAPKTVANGIYGKFLANRYDDGAWLTTQRATRWITQRDSDSPFFLFLNYLEPHLEYDPPAGYAEKFLPKDTDPTAVDDINQDQWRYIAGQEEMTARDFESLTALYEAELNYLDLHIGRLYRALSEAEILDDTVVVIVSDHGENIGEHGMMDHQYCLYETLLHVPLVVRYPDEFPAGSDVEEIVETRDLYPTLLDLAGIDYRESDESVSTNSLVPSSDSDGALDRAMAEYVTPQPSMEALEEHVGHLPPDVEAYDRALRSIRTEKWKLIEGSDGSRELYDVTSDLSEVTDVAADNEAVVERLADRLERERGPMRREATDSAALNERSRERLENLGYI